MYWNNKGWKAMQTIKLYHISYDTSEPLDKEFIPKIPHNTVSGEDESVPRICFSDSIEGCINAVEDQLGNYENEDRATIIVWEMEFLLPNDKLIGWQKLYEDNLVPDAVFTHEYWFLDKLRMKGTLYEILDINDAISNKKEIYLIKPQYQETVLRVFSDYGADLKEIEKYDLYTLVNEWLPTVLPERMTDIIEKLKEEIRIVDDTDLNITALFDSSSKSNTLLDMDFQKIYHNLEIRKKH